MAKKGLSGSTIKIIAMLTMLVDHVGVMLGNTFPVQKALFYSGNFSELLNGTHSLTVIYVIMRLIGRIAFPLFIFLLVEGYMHTKSRIRYALRVGLLGLISEIPFNLLSNQSVFYLSYQNVCITLFLGLVMLMIFTEIEKYGHKKEMKRFFIYVYEVLVMLAFSVIAYGIRCDYSYKGIICIAIMYFLYYEPILGYIGMVAILTSFSTIELASILGIVCIAFYNKSQGLKLKYVFYAFYPIHLLIIYYASIIIHI